MKIELLCNGWISLVNTTAPLGAPRQVISIETRMTATIDGTPEQLAALRHGLNRGWKPEFWIVREVKE